MNITELIDQAKHGAGIETDYRLAKTLGISDAAVTHWRSGRAKPSDWHLIRLAEMARIDQAQVLAQAQIGKAKTEEERTAWQSISDRLARVAACVLAGVMLSGLPVSKSEAATTTYNGIWSTGKSID